MRNKRKEREERKKRAHSCNKARIRLIGFNPSARDDGH